MAYACLTVANIFRCAKGSNRQLFSFPRSQFGSSIPHNSGAAKVVHLPHAKLKLNKNKSCKENSMAAVRHSTAGAEGLRAAGAPPYLGTW